MYPPAGTQGNQEISARKVVNRGTGYENLQVSKAIRKMLQFMLKVLRPCAIFV